MIENACHNMPHLIKSSFLEYPGLLPFLYLIFLSLSLGSVWHRIELQLLDAFNLVPILQTVGTFYELVIHLVWAFPHKPLLARVF